VTTVIGLTGPQTKYFRPQVTADQMLQLQALNDHRPAQTKWSVVILAGGKMRIC